MQDVVNKIIDCCQRHRKPASMMALSAEGAKPSRARGVDILVHGVDSHRIREGLGRIIEEASDKAEGD